MPTWTNPKTWNTGDVLIASELNTEIRDNFLAIKSPPTAHYELNESADYTTTATAFVDVDGTNLSLTITPSGDTVLVGFNGSVSNQTTGQTVYLDLDIDGTRFSGDDGVLLCTGTALYGLNACFVLLVTGLTAGAAHTFKLQWKVNSGTGVMRAGAGVAAADIHPQFWVREIS